MRGRPLHRNDANSLLTNDDLISPFDVEKFNRSSDTLCRLDYDRAIHHRRTNFHLLATDAHERLLISRDVEIIREYAIRRRGRQLRIGPLHHFRSVLTQAYHQLTELFSGLRADFDPVNALVGA